MYSIEHTGDGINQCIRLVDAQARSSATIAAGYGWNCFSFVCDVNGRPLDFLYAAEGFPSREHRPSHHGTPILAPFPNRIREGKFRFDGQDYQIPCNEQGKNAIHGFVIDQPWRVTQHRTSPQEGCCVRAEVVLSLDLPEFVPYWPTDFLLAVTYRLKDRCLRCDIEIENRDQRPLPFGFGTHPYFRFPLERGGSLEECHIVSPLAKHVELVDCLPTGKIYDVTGDDDLRRGMRLDRRTFDDVFTDIEVSDDQTVVHTLRDESAGAQLTLRHDTQFRYAVVYTPAHREAICIEPYTCVTDAVHLQHERMDAGWWELAPGEKRSLWIEYVASPL